MAAIQDEDRQVLNELADLAESIGRRVRTVHCTRPEDLTDIRDDANYLAENLQSVRDTINARS